MSVLLDALDRAERSRREQQHPELRLEARSDHTVPAGTRAEGEAQAQQGRLFDAGPGAPGRRSPLQWLAALLILGVGGAAGWWLLAPEPARPPSGPANADSHASASPAAPAVRRPAGVELAPAVGVPSTPAGAAAAPAAPAPQASRPAQSAAGAQTAPPVAALARPAARNGTDSTVLAAAGAGGDRDADERPPVRSERRPGASRQAAAQAQPRNAPAVDIQLFRNPARSAADPGVLAAWTALRDGRLDDARVRYLSLEPGLSGNVDIQLGLARIAAEQGQTAEARQRYQRALVLDPLNRTAQAGLAILEPAARDSHLDSQLRASAAAHEPLAQFALAARMSAAGQWPEAEQAWFEALRADPDNPDLLFNLAVALDHLGQTPAARRHYQDALQASGSRGAHFDRAALETRLRALASE